MEAGTLNTSERRATRLRLCASCRRGTTHVAATGLGGDKFAPAWECSACGAVKPRKQRFPA